MARSLLRATGLMALLLLVSKGAGFLREVAVAHAYGAGIVKDANTVAYNLPALFLILLGGLNGPFHLATMGAITRLKAQGKDDEIPGLLLTILLGTTALTGAIALLVAIAAPWVVLLNGPMLGPEAHALAVVQLRLMSPLIVIGGVLGVLCGISNVRDRFANSSLSPMVSSLAVIAIVLVTASPLAIAWGTLIGAIGQLVLQAVPVLQDWREITGGRPVKPVPLSHAGFGEMLRMLLPAGLSSSVGNINVMIATAFCSSLGSGAISYFNYSNQLFQLPLGILLTALLVPMFPRLTEAAAKGDREALFGWINRGVQALALVTLPLSGLMIVLAQPAVALAFQRGAFSAHDTAMTATVLAIVALSTFAYATRDLFTRLFYAQNKSRVPLLVTSVSIGTTLLFNALLVRFGIPGLAASTVLVTLGNLFLLGWLLRREMGTLGLGPSVPTLLKALVAAAGATLLAWLAANWLPAQSWVPGFAPLSVPVKALVRLVAGGTVAIATYLGLLLALRAAPLAQLRTLGAIGDRVAPEPRSDAGRV